MGDVNRRLVALGDIVTTEGKAGCVEMMEALLNALLHTDSQRQFAEQQVTAIRIHLIERPAKFEAIEHLGAHPLTKQEIERFVGKKLRGQGQWPIRKPQAIEDHPGHGFPGCDVLLVIGHNMRVDQLYDAQILDDTRNNSSMVQAFHDDRVHSGTPSA